MRLIRKQSYYVRCPALELLWNSLCGPRAKKFGDPGLKYSVNGAMAILKGDLGGPWSPQILVGPPFGPPVFFVISHLVSFC